MCHHVKGGCHIFRHEASVNEGIFERGFLTVGWAMPEFEGCDGGEGGMDPRKGRYALDARAVRKALMVDSGVGLLLINVVSCA